MSKTYDAIIVGARCAGSSTAMHLARKGYRVLVVDRATFPSDTVSTFTDARSFDDAMREYQRDRDEHVLPMYEFTCQLAAMEPPPPEMQQVLASKQGNQKAMDAFAQMNAGTISPMALGAVVGAR
jgi:choline dehydrogenase-like flavoprotein